MIQRHNDLLIPLLPQHQGTLIEIIGDAFLARLTSRRRLSLVR